MASLHRNMDTALLAQAGLGALVSGPLLVSFSGIDGAGKTTQIENTIAWLQEARLSVRVVRFWDDIASFRRLRENLGHALFGGEHGVGAPGKPVRRRDKDVRAWYVLPARMALCLFDSVSLAIAVKQLRREPAADVIIFDRYIYDQFANLEIRNRFVNRYLRLLLESVPRPDIAFLLDADPDLARERKPEYPLEFLRMNRGCYLELSSIAGMTVIPPGTSNEVADTIVRKLQLLPAVRLMESRASSHASVGAVHSSSLT